MCAQTWYRPILLWRERPILLWRERPTSWLTGQAENFGIRAVPSSWLCSHPLRVPDQAQSCQMTEKWYLAFGHAPADTGKRVPDISPL
jgi:hypothetical protein